MVSIEGKIALVTGASSGIGISAVELMLEAGATVYAAARRIEKMKDIENRGANLVKIDLTDDGSVTLGVTSILEKERSIDILINNAGYGSYGAIEDVPIDEARRQFEVNIFGLARLTQLVLPRMRENKFGKIVNISSMGGKMYSPFGGWYHATKHALEGLTDCLRIEIKEFGIDAILVEPGGIATEWGAISAQNLKKTSGKGAYSKTASRVAVSMAQMYSSGKLSPPSVIGKVILKAVTAKKPKTRYVAGYMAAPVLFLRHWLSDSLFDRIVKSMI